MATIYSTSRIKLVAAVDSASHLQKIFERDNNAQDQVVRTDFQATFQGAVTVTATKAKTFTLTETDLTVIRAIYIESTQPVTVSLLDDTAAANELTTFVLAGPAGAGACTMYAECESFTVAADDTFVITCPGATAADVVFCLLGDTATES